jgi:hypothetical protein
MEGVVEVEDRERELHSVDVVVLNLQQEVTKDEGEIKGHKQCSMALMHQIHFDHTVAQNGTNLAQTDEHM